jgi:hypothetical protein
MLLLLLLQVPLLRWLKSLPRSAYVLQMIDRVCCAVV